VHFDARFQTIPASQMMEVVRIKISVEHSIEAML
jgi:hypothetical protein